MKELHLFYFLRKMKFFHISTKDLKVDGNIYILAKLNNPPAYLRTFEVSFLLQDYCPHNLLNISLLTCLSQDIVGEGNPEALQDSFRLDQPEGKIYFHLERFFTLNPFSRSSSVQSGRWRSWAALQRNMLIRHSETQITLFNWNPTTD